MAAIDRIVIKENGTQRNLTVAQWKALPLTERVQKLRGDVEFYAGGQTVSAKDALQQLR
jgi:hypothetical protein